MLKKREQKAVDKEEVSDKEEDAEKDEDSSSDDSKEEKKEPLQQQKKKNEEEDADGTESEEESESAEQVGVKKKKSLKRAAKDNINKLNQQLGHKASNAPVIQKKKRSVTLKAAHELCLKYLCDDHKDTVNEVYSLGIYRAVKTIENLCKK